LATYVFILISIRNIKIVKLCEWGISVTHDD
jgi:hypothetical protein